jgi:ubiquinone/menaquinone biosynthesis C-methylase UbiE
MNIDAPTVEGFGDEWTRFDQADLPEDERQELFDRYFAVFPWHLIDRSSVGADVGCGSGRWAALMAPRVGTLHCVEPSRAIDVAQRALRGCHNVQFHQTVADRLPFPDESLDFAYSLGVLHHVPDTVAALHGISRKLKPGAPLLVYIYYAFDNRPAWYAGLWRATEAGRRAVSRLPHAIRYPVSQVIAGLVYWPVARLARLLDVAGALPTSFPLAFYRDKSFYTMRTDALDRFGTRLEQRFTRTQIRVMMRGAGLDEITFSDDAPFWCAIGYKRSVT